jgi:hypothetical protein
LGRRKSRCLGPAFGAAKEKEYHYHDTPVQEDVKKIKRQAPTAGLFPFQAIHRRLTL